jgi:hypothetical protein
MDLSMRVLMVDRAKRLRAEQVLREFLQGTISNFDFEEQFPQSGPDKALVAIANVVWFTYDDLSTHRLVNEHALSEAESEILARCLLFLATDLEYFGPTRFVAPDIPKDEDPPGRLERLLNPIALRFAPKKCPLKRTKPCRRSST